MSFIKALLLSILIFSTSLFGSDKEYDSWDDLNETLSLLLRGSYLQFTQSNNLYYLGAGTAATWYSLENDKRLSNLERSKKIPGYINTFDGLSIAFNFPIIPLSAYYFGRSSENHHLVQFAKEYMAAMYLALAESGVISYIPIHKRPSVENLSPWETNFRGDSSFPSGHVIPFMTLFFKTMQFYGPYWSVIPLGLSYLASLQRVRDGKHWVSDVVSSFFLSAFASEGVRAAAGHKKNHPFYKWAFEHDVKLGVFHKDGSFYPRLSLSF